MAYWRHGQEIEHAERIHFNRLPKGTVYDSEITKMDISEDKATIYDKF